MPGKVISQEEWIQKRIDLLQKEKEAQRTLDGIGAQIRDLGMVPVTKPYTFTDTNSGLAVELSDLFDGRQQLIVYHFMLAPDQKAGCNGCSFVADQIPDLTHLNARNTTLALVSRAPMETINAYKERMGWTFPWFSSFGSDFNYDFQATLDESVRPVEYNYDDKETLAKKKNVPTKGESPGLSVFFRKGRDIFHSYSTYARGLERVLTTNALLDVTPLGRQDDRYGDWKRHDEYEPTELHRQEEVA